jgi:hypothetical protein
MIPVRFRYHCILQLGTRGIGCGNAAAQPLRSPRSHQGRELSRESGARTAFRRGLQMHLVLIALDVASRARQINRRPEEHAR